MKTAGPLSANMQPAGITRMPYLRTFLPWNVSGGVLWGAGCVLLGYGFSATLASVGRYLTLGPLLLIGLLLVGVALVRMLGWHRTRGRSPMTAICPEKRRNAEGAGLGHSGLVEHSEARAGTRTLGKK